MTDNKGIISAIAFELSERYGVPSPLLQVAEDEFIRVICDDYGSTSFDGLTWFEPRTEEFYIHLNTNPARKNSLESTKGRFTLAHELGHYFIPSHRLGLMRGDLKPHGSINYLLDLPSWQIEREADSFASSLLMPSNRVHDMISGRPFCFHIIDEIAQQFQVSKSAAALRFAQIGNYPIMIVFAVDGKICWVKRSEDFPFWRLRYGSGKGDRVPEYTVMGSYFYDNDNSDCRKAETVYAQDCFSTRLAEDNMREFYEWCIEYRNSAFSVFWEK